MKYLYPLACILFFSSCNDNNNNKPIDEWELNKNTRILNNENSSYQEARRLAQANIGSFIKSFDNNRDSLEFYIKAGFSDERGAENMWVRVYSVGDSMLGVLDNNPITIRKNRLGDSVVVNIIEIVDFSIYKGDSVIQGNYLNQVLEK
ncbi:DUF2314 domain-containing protein [Hymenobacter radiodurans]|uniref:DUF2314 domain-containing protein n=1 Tax=Hymenobacter radiodurans TaxID=2496028 RepID=UPI001058C135|nr:DUF2314 domain-containing protein [Hymenobacter radiodurans]